MTRRGEQKYRYNNKGQLIHAMERDKFQTWYCYDDLDRLVMWYDDKDNITQFFYANLLNPNVITHMHQPKSKRTFRLEIFTFLVLFGPFFGIFGTLLGVLGTILGVLGTILGVLRTILGVLRTILGVFRTLLGVIRILSWCPWDHSLVP